LWLDHKWETGWTFHMPVRLLNGGLRGKCLEVLDGYPIVVGAQVGKPEGHSICLHVLDSGLHGKCLDGV
jgi:hypothetical protein